MHLFEFQYSTTLENKIDRNGWIEALSEALMPLYCCPDSSKVKSLWLGFFQLSSGCNGRGWMTDLMMYSAALMTLCSAFWSCLELLHEVSDVM